MKRLSVILLALVMMIVCRAQDCSKLPGSFNSYAQATSLVKASSFKLKESANTSESSWITSAKYYSCDGNTGYFIFTTNKGKEYIHKDVPLDVW